MKKLTTAQWIAFAFATAGLIVAQLEQYGVTIQIIGGVSSALGTLKLIYDLYLSFQAQDVANFANEQKLTGAEARKAHVSKTDVKDWASK